MKRVLFALLMSVAVSASAEDRNINTIAGISVIPSTNWKSGQFISREDYLNLDFDTTQFTSYEGSI